MFIITGDNVLIQQIQTVLYIVVCFASTMFYAIVFVILSHFHVKIGDFLERYVGVPRFVQHRCLYFFGWIFACVILIAVFYEHITKTYLNS